MNGIGQNEVATLKVCLHYGKNAAFSRLSWPFIFTEKNQVNNTSQPNAKTPRFCRNANEPLGKTVNLSRRTWRSSFRRWFLPKLPEFSLAEIQSPVTRQRSSSPPILDLERYTSNKLDYFYVANCFLKRVNHVFLMFSILHSVRSLAQFQRIVDDQCDQIGRFLYFGQLFKPLATINLPKFPTFLGIFW